MPASPDSSEEPLPHSHLHDGKEPDFREASPRSLPAKPRRREVTVTSTQTQTDISWDTALTLSPQTCLDLIPSLTDAQLEHEFYWMGSVVGRDLGTRATRGTPSPSAVQKALHDSLINVVLHENKKTVYDCSAYQTLIDSFACALGRAETYVSEMQKPTPRDQSGGSSFYDAQLPEDEQVVVPKSPPSSSPPPLLLPEPVCLLGFNVGETISAESFLTGIEYTKVGSRRVAHFGDHEYKYGRTRHPARPYPDHPALNQIIDSLGSNLGGDMKDYSCLVTVYDNNTSHIPWHSDDEPSIEPSSTIITVSLGQTRTLHFRNCKGQLDPGNTHHSITLPHGSVHTMTRESQDFWQHSIPPTTSDMAGIRVSLTLRRLQEVTHQTVPPIAQPSPSLSHTATTKQHRVLFLTDSLHRDSFPTHLFPDKITCFKKPIYELNKICDFSSEFSYTDIVFISCGINDISRYGWNADSLFAHVKVKIEQWKLLYPQTQFIFNSLVGTQIDWLNEEVGKFNEYMFNFLLDLDRGESKFLFFDSSDICLYLWNQGVTITNPISRWSNGIHLTHPAKREISGIIIRCLSEQLLGTRHRAQFWPLRRRFRDVHRAQGRPQ